MFELPYFGVFSLIIPCLVFSPGTLPGVKLMYIYQQQYSCTGGEKRLAKEKTSLYNKASQKNIRRF